MLAHGPILSVKSSRRRAAELQIDPLSWVGELLEVGGPDAALAFLNARVEHRSSLIYRLAGDTLYLVHYYDSLGEEPLAILKAVPLAQSFCQFALKDGGFATRESMNEPRLQGNPLRSMIASYVGLPLLRPDGSFFGSLCHVDIVPRSITNEEFEFQERAAALFTPYLGG